MNEGVSSNLNGNVNDNSAVIRVENVGKSYNIYEKPQDRLKQLLSMGRKKYFKEFWALKDISFNVVKGEMVGIVGRNGSGKSTLLQIVAGTLMPSSGSVWVSGRITALLELGSGFNPDFTGRENIYMNGAILGLQKEEIDDLYNDIVNFADIGEFIDRPIKTYSSGMAVRLAFAVQVMVPKEVLIVDEALAVGDELFQRKCYAKMEEFRRQGGTVLFVSHAGGTVVELCERAILVDDGELLMIGESKRVVNLYQKLLYAPVEKKEQIKHDIRKNVNYLGQNPQNRNYLQHSPNNYSRSSHLVDFVEEYDPGLIPKNTILYESRGADIYNPEIVTVEGKKVNILHKGRKYIWRYRVRFTKNCSNVRFGMLIKTVSGLELGGAATAKLGNGIPFVEQGKELVIEFAFIPKLSAGVYFLNGGVLETENGEEVYLNRGIELGAFRIVIDEHSTSTGIVDFDISSGVIESKEASSL
ncbi:ABC transporter ATP-binding protein [Alicyclobacillus tolerans]|uniref:ABC transporter ATP-binding protein n=1 Tax=Alicyclobacillus tolerans TaxID=90970 RepID=UPI001F299C36|nr:ABC transporter ATP-binding protein [Alicyclobacillus tolerans]MCF8567860.1 ABC transporter ATP-binding protein [Alicyclobacillus tolerans]